MNITDFINKWTTLFADTPIKNISAEKLRDFTADTGSLLSESTGTSSFPTKTKRIGFTNGYNAFTGIEILTVSDGDYYSYIYVYDNGNVIMAYGTDEGGRFSLKSNPSVDTQLNFGELYDNYIPTKSNLLSVYRDVNIFQDNIVFLPTNLAYRKKYFIKYVTMVTATAFNYSNVVFVYNSAIAPFLGEEFEIYFFATWSVLINFKYVYDGDYTFTDQFSIESGKYYKLSVCMLPKGNIINGKLYPYATLNEVASMDSN